MSFEKISNEEPLDSASRSARILNQKSFSVPIRGPRRLVFKSNSRLFFVNPNEISRIEAEREYVKLYIGSETRLIRMTMDAVEKRLREMPFLRVHRSTIVNLDFVKEIRPQEHGDYVVLMRDQTEIKLSRTHRSNLHKLMVNAFDTQ
jgi:two-component system LytT family response regulator